MKYKVERIKSILEIIKIIIEILTLLGVFSIFLGVIAKFFNESKLLLLTIFSKYFIEIWLVTISLIVILTYLKISRLHSKFISKFHDNFDDFKNWENIENWKIDKNSLIITNSNEGGIIKIGKLWENYEMTLKAKIENKCIGIIIRAQDLNNYYMIQITNNRIRPHRRVPIPKIDEKTRLITYDVSWQVFEDKCKNHGLILKDWFDIKLIVKGNSISLYINNKEVFYDSFLLMIPFGRIGFRNYADEKAIIKKLKVKLI